MSSKTGTSILYLAHRAPFPADKGDRIRGFRHLSRLATLGTVDLVAMADSEAEAAIAREGLRPLCRRVEVVPRQKPRALLKVGLNLLAGESLTAAWCDDQRVRDRLDRLRAEERRYDLVFAYSSGTGPWLERVNAAKKVVDLCDLDALKWQALAGDGGPMAPVYGLEARRLLPIEQKLGETADLCFLSTPQEASDLCALGRPHNLQILTNGAPWQDFSDLAPPAEAPPVVAFLGQMDYPPNVMAACHLAREVMPKVWRARPEARLRIIGRAPAPAVCRLAEAGRIEVTGAVASVPQALAGVRIFCAPLDRGRGIPNKILDALAAGRATVISSWSAKALSGEVGRDYLVADGGPARAALIAGLLNDPARCNALGAAGQRYVRENHDWDRVLDQLEATLGALFEDSAQTPPLAPARPPRRPGRRRFVVQEAG
jgi:sugar transferase (PEP-CTERM/EpsH1 system associated)